MGSLVSGGLPVTALSGLTVQAAPGPGPGPLPDSNQSPTAGDGSTSGDGGDCAGLKPLYIGLIVGLVTAAALCAAVAAAQYARRRSVDSEDDRVR